MAVKTKDNSKNPKSNQKSIVQNSVKNKTSQILQGILAVVLALVIVALVFCGVFYIVLKNNVYGLGDFFRPAFKDSPILRLALPKEYDPDAPENLTDEEVRKKYEEYRQKVSELTAELEEARGIIAQYESDRQALDENKAVLEANKQVLTSIQKEQEKLEQQKAEMTRLIAEGNKDGFKEYYSQIDAEAAAAIYKELVKEDINRQIKSELAKAYAAMEPARAAGVLTELWDKDQETAIGIFEGLNANAQAQILQNMEASVAADITKTLSDRKLIK